MKARLIILALCLLTVTTCLGFGYFDPFTDNHSTFFDGGWQYFYKVNHEPGDTAWASFSIDLTLHDGLLYSTRSSTFDTDYRPSEGIELLEGETYIRLFRVDNSVAYYIRVENGLSKGHYGIFRFHSILSLGDELLLLCENGEIIRYRPGEETARNLGETLESPYPLSWSDGQPYINSTAIFNGELYGYLLNTDEAEGGYGSLVRFEENNGSFRAVEETKIMGPDISYRYCSDWPGNILIAADETGFWIYYKYLMGLVHVLPDGTRQRWLPVPDFGVYSHYKVGDGELEPVWDSGPSEKEFIGIIRGHSVPCFGDWRPNELLFQTFYTNVIWVLDLDVAPVLEVPDRWLVVTANALNMRSGPGTHYENLGLIRQWDTALIVGETVVEDDIWYRVVTFAGEVCWLRSGRDGKVWVHVLPKGEKPYFPILTDA